MKDFANLLDRQEDICIGKVTVMSGVRPSGRTIDQRASGRKLHGLFYILRGEARFFENEEDELITRGGDLVYIPKACKYKMQYCAEATTFVLVNFDLFTNEGVDTVLCEGITVISRDERDLRIASVMSELELSASVAHYAAMLRRKELIYKLLGMVFEKEISQIAKDGRYTQVLAGALLLQQTYLENLPISEFAKASGMSISSFRDLFTKKYGMSPVQYRNHLRIKRAGSILREGSCTVAEAAYASGFENIGYFCRYYKKVTGETPSDTKAHNA